MKIVTRYLLKQLLVPFLVALFLFTVVLLFIRLFHLTDLVINKGVPLRGILLVLAARVPETFNITVPMSLIMAVVMTYGRLSEDNEITALRMAGYSLQSLLVPPLAVGLILALFLVGINQFGLPQLTNYKERTLARLQMVNPMGLLQPKTYLDIPPYTLYADEVDGKNMKNVWIEDRSQSTPQIIVSKRGNWIRQTGGGYKLVLKKGALHQKGAEENYRVLQFDRQTINFNPGDPTAGNRQEASALTLWEKYQKYRRLQKELTEKAPEDPGNMSSDRERFLEHATNFHRTLALPFATFFLVLLTAPAGMLTKNYGKIADLVICLGTFLIYYLTFSLIEPLALEGHLMPGLAMWTPNIVFGLLGFGTILYLKKTGG